LVGRVDFVSVIAGIEEVVTGPIDMVDECHRASRGDIRLRAIECQLIAQRTTVLRAR
jgi:hypothetical protein